MNQTQEDICAMTENSHILESQKKEDYKKHSNTFKAPNTYRKTAAKHNPAQAREKRPGPNLEKGSRKPSMLLSQLLL